MTPIDRTETKASNHDASRRTARGTARPQCRPATVRRERGGSSVRNLPSRFRENTGFGGRVEWSLLHFFGMSLLPEMPDRKK
ncbi:MAG: hypothetical protein R2762_14995 [Bryobacteraceae bacterium]